MKYTYEIVQSEDIIRFNPEGSIRSDESLDVFAEMSEKVTSLALKQRLNVIIDFSGLKLINSSGIGKLLMLNKSIKGNGLDFSITGLSPTLNQLFKFARIDAVLNIVK